MGKRKGTGMQAKKGNSTAPTPTLSFGVDADTSIRSKHWNRWVDRVHGSMPAQAAANLVSRAKSDYSNEGEVDLISAAIYLDPFNLDAWCLLLSYAKITTYYVSGGVTSANASRATLADYESSVTDTLGALKSYLAAIRSRKYQTHELVSTLAPLVDPAVRELWGWVFEHGRDQAKSYVNGETAVCYLVRDLVSGFDTDLGVVANPAAAVLAPPILTTSILIGAASDAERVEEALWTADYLLALVEKVPERAARDLDLGALIYFVATAALDHWKQAGTLAMSWGHLAYSFAPGIKERAKAAYLLASLLYESGNVEDSHSHFIYTYAHAQDPFDRWKAALRITSLIGTDQGDMEAATRWAEKAEQLRPDGQGFAVLSAAARRSGNWLEALEASLRSTTYEWPEQAADIRRVALLGLARNVVGGRKWTSPAEFERAMAAIAEAAPQIIPELKEKLVASINALAEENATERESLAAEIESLRRQVKDGGSPDSSDSAAAEMGAALVRDDLEIRNYAKSCVLTDYPEVGGRALDGLTDAYALRWILDRAGYGSARPMRTDGSLCEGTRSPPPIRS